jgi:ABC-type branched-subunit amino acid transport system permease subunit
MFWFYGMLVVGGLGNNLGLFLGVSAITLIDGKTGKQIFP